MSASSQSVDNIDALLDLSEYDNLSSYQSPSLSPATTSKNGFTTAQRPVSQSTSPTMPPTSQSLTGPSHQYELYKQQTGIVPGALASTLAVSNSQVSGYNAVNLDYLGLSPSDDLFDFNTSPSQETMDMEMDFDSPSDNLYFQTVSPNALTGQTSPSLTSPGTIPSQSSHVGRLYPGMHSQAALAKAQAQQRQQQHIIQQQRQNAAQAKPRSKSTQATDPIVEQKITQLLNSMRAKPASQLGDNQSQAPLLNLTRPKKDEDDMDEDERLLASEEGKKLSSKERRQLRNKVSARAFRSRRKEYITQLESEVAGKVNENSDLRAQNRSLMEENKRLSDLTRMLLSSPSFSNFLDNLSASAMTAPQPEAPTKAEQPQQQSRQVPKDVNPAAYAAATQVQRQQIGMAMIPEQSMDFSMLSLENDSTFNFQPQVFALLETPEMPASIEANLLAGKESNFVGEHFDSDDEKIELPAISRPKREAPEAPEEPPFNPEFESNPEFALFHSSRRASDESEAPTVDIFGGIEPEKVLARYELLDASEEERSNVLAVAKVERLSDRLEPIMERLDSLTLN
jgi:bZIP-type transcription factor MBZ1